MTGVKKFKILKINVFDFPIMDMEETKVGEVDDHLEKDFRIGFELICGSTIFSP
jgi:hypothetical protein